MRQYFVKTDIEGAECRAMRGMVGFLSRVDARSIVGFQMEWHLAGRECCSELVAPGGAFEILHTRHGLCPRAASKAQIIGKAVLRLSGSQVRTSRIYPAQTPLSSLSALRADGASFLLMC